MNRNQEAIRPRTIHAIIEDDLVLAAPSDDYLPPASAEEDNREPAGSPIAGLRTYQPESHREHQKRELTELEDFDEAIAEIGRRATFGFAALLELPILLAMHKR